MDCIKTGALIKNLRIKNKLTQNELAEKLIVSPSAVSKWERGLGAPDISLISNLAGIFNVDVNCILEGELEIKNKSGNNMKKTNFFVCPTCQNVVSSISSAEVYCCGNALKTQKAQKASKEEELVVEEIENELYVTACHEMTKENYLSFIALVTNDALFMKKLYPEWEAQARIPKLGHGILLQFSTSKGLLFQYI